MGRKGSQGRPGLGRTCEGGPRNWSRGREGKSGQGSKRGQEPESYGAKGQPEGFGTLLG